MLITIVLSNGTPEKLNIVDDSAGNPFMGVDAGTNNIGGIGFGLGHLVNSLKLNLAPGASLTNTVRLTNPPPQLRLFVEARDLASEVREMPMELLRFLTAKVTHRPPAPHDYILLARSPWMSGNISNTTWNATTFGGTNSATP